MNFGKMLSFLSPAAGMMSGNGAGLLPFLSPGFGMLSGKGPFGKMLGGHDDKSQQGQPQVMPQAPASMMSGQPTGMFGATPPQMGGQDDMLARYRQMLMSQYGGGY